MSEYQYYEFLAIDRPLTANELDELRALSTRATITPVSFTNEYNWGDFKGDPHKLMQRYFDAHVYVANWMTAIFMVRLPIEEWAKPIIAHGPRPTFEMEQVLPGEDPDNPFDDPITRSNDLKDAGHGAEAKKILMELCRADLRCLDAHSHLGNFVFDQWPQNAIRHYEVGLRIGQENRRGADSGFEAPVRKRNSSWGQGRLPK